MTDKSIIRMCGTEPESIVDGPGFRYVIFVQGCPHRCPGCHNPQSHDFEAGYDLAIEDLWNDICQSKAVSGITFSGGEPFCQVEPLLEIAHRAKEAGLHLMSYSGYTYEQLLERNDPATDEFLSLMDILVDGPFVEAERNLELTYRGSENQRVIDLNKTRKAGTIVPYRSSFDLDF